MQEKSKTPVELEMLKHYLRDVNDFLYCFVSSGENLAEKDILNQLADKAYLTINSLIVAIMHKQGHVEKE